MTRTGKPETVSLTVNGPTRTHGQHTNPTPCAGSGAGKTGRTEHMQEQMNNTEPNFITNVYVHETKLQCNPAIKEDKARRIAKKTAKALRNTIMDGQHDIWKIRNQVKHGITEDGKMAHETIEMLIEERAQYKIDTPMTATDVAKWTKAKQNKWKKYFTINTY